PAGRVAAGENRAAAAHRQRNRRARRGGIIRHSESAVLAWQRAQGNVLNSLPSVDQGWCAERTFAFPRENDKKISRGGLILDNATADFDRSAPGTFDARSGWLRATTARLPARCAPPALWRCAAGNDARSRRGGHLRRPDERQRRRRIHPARDRLEHDVAEGG